MFKQIKTKHKHRKYTDISEGKRNKSLDKKGSNFLDINRNMKSMRNFILKSDYCNNPDKALDTPYLQTANPMIQYYDVNNCLSSSKGSSWHHRLNDDENYSIFVTKSSNNLGLDIWEKSDSKRLKETRKKKKEIIVNTYEEEGEENGQCCFAQFAHDRDLGTDEVNYYDIVRKTREGDVVNWNGNSNNTFNQQVKANSKFWEDTNNTIPHKVKFQQEEWKLCNKTSFNINKGLNYHKTLLKDNQIQPEINKNTNVHPRSNWYHTHYNNINLNMNLNITMFQHMMMVQQYQKQARLLNDLVNHSTMKIRSPLNKTPLNSKFYTKSKITPLYQTYFDLTLHSNANRRKVISQKTQCTNVNTDKSTYSSYTDIHIASLSSYWIKEESGCRFIQEKIVADSNFANNILFRYLLEDVLDLINDPFGNYLFQVLIDKLTPDNNNILFDCIKSNFWIISLNQHGTRVIQKLIEILPTNEDWRKSFISLFTKHILEIAKNPYGNHVILKFLYHFPYPENAFIYETLYTNFTSIANTKHGCCVVQKCLMKATEAQGNMIIISILNNLAQIISDQYGNYIIQFLFYTAYDSRNRYTIKPIIEAVTDNIVFFCKQKYASNALEKCFESDNFDLQRLFLDKLSSDDNKIKELIVDSFGNYVIQKALKSAKGGQYMKMLEAIAVSFGKIKEQTFGNKLIGKLLSAHRELGGLIMRYEKEVDKETYYSAD